MTLKKIVVPVDFNELSTAALEFAGNLARQTSAELVVMYADTFDPPPEFTATQLDDVATSLERSRRRAEEELENHVAKHLEKGIRWKAVVAEGSPAASALRVARAEDADMIAIGTHGRGGIQRLVFGSVAERIMRDAPVPVLTVHSRRAADAVRRILCPVDRSDASGQALDQAWSLAEATGAELTILCLNGIPTCSERMVGHRHVKVVSREGADPVKEILAFDDGSYDLIVVGAQPTRFGASMTGVTRQARTPVVTVVRHAVGMEKEREGETADVL